jgi:hypothetical protein
LCDWDWELSTLAHFFLFGKRVEKVEVCLGMLGTVALAGASAARFLLLVNFRQIFFLTYTKDFSQKKMTQIRQIFKNFLFKSPDFYDKFQ